MVKKEPKPRFKTRVRRFKKATIEKKDAVKKGVKDTLNINRYNKWLFIFETILLVGVIDEYFEGLIMGLNYGTYLNIILLMLSIGTLFYIALAFIEKIGKGAIVWVVRLNSNKILRFITHAAILFGLFYLYAKVFFDIEIGLVFQLGLTNS